MKLRNKKTGDLSSNIELSYDKESFKVIVGENIYEYSSLAELNAEWEDYAPAEPLIKDEKIRKAVRAWAEACFNDKYFMVYDLRYVSFKLKADRSDATIALYVDEPYWIQFLVKNKSYTIAELCGEE